MLALIIAATYKQAAAKKKNVCQIQKNKTKKISPEFYRVRTGFELSTFRVERVNLATRLRYLETCFLEIYYIYNI